jgi:hypothetical protein
VSLPWRGKREGMTQRTTNSMDQSGLRMEEQVITKHPMQELFLPPWNFLHGKGV